MFYIHILFFNTLNTSVCNICSATYSNRLIIFLSNSLQYILEIPSCIISADRPLFQQLRITVVLILMQHPVTGWTILLEHPVTGGVLKSTNTAVYLPPTNSDLKFLTLFL